MSAYTAKFLRLLPYEIQSTYTRTLDMSLFTRYEKLTAMYNWSTCMWLPQYSTLTAPVFRTLACTLIQHQTRRFSSISTRAFSSNVRQASFKKMHDNCFLKIDNNLSKSFLFYLHANSYTIDRMFLFKEKSLSATLELNIVKVCNFVYYQIYCILKISSTLRAFDNIFH